MVNCNELTIGALVRSSNDFAQVTALYKEEDGIHVEGNVFCGDDPSPEDVVELIPLLEVNGWIKTTTSPITYIHPLLGDSNKVIFDKVAHYRDMEVLYVHHLQNLLAIANKKSVDIDLQRLCK